MIRDKITDAQRAEAEAIFILALGANFQTSFDDDNNYLFIGYQYGPNYQVNYRYISPDGTVTDYNPRLEDQLL